MGRGATGPVGRRAEQHAQRFLERHGLRLVARNFRCRGGEIDLIMLDGDDLAFIEVRYRKSAAFAAPALTVDGRKQRRIIATAARFAARRRQFALMTMRFDVVAITGDGGGETEWIRDAFRPTDASL